MKTVREIYCHFHLDRPSGFDSYLGEYFEQNPKDKHSGHRYRAKDFRQTDEDIASHFREYWEEFGNV